MKKIDFDLEYYKKHHPLVETVDGRKVRIIATDVKGDEPIVGLVDYGRYERVFSYNEYGTVNAIDYREMLELQYYSLVMVVH